ncbi:MAG TPA: TetR/AcrR family transcriptional regulator [Streptosporangiaceae bacterium]|nr:TetR/AcrR family transcriptional regulator [Streptosporangiaceae bacterium]
MATARRQAADVTRVAGATRAAGVTRVAGATRAAGVSRARQASERIRHPTEVRRALIVEAARSVIAERGLFATTMRDIAAASGVSLGTVTYHFQGIAEILAAVLDGEMDAFYAPLVAAATAALDGRAALHALIDGFLTSSPRARQHWVLWLDFWALSAHDGEYASRQTAVYRRWQGDVEAMFRRGAADGTLRVGDQGQADGLDEAGALDEAVAEFMAVFDGMASKAYLPGADIRPAEARSRLHRYVDRISR